MPFTFSHPLFAIPLKTVRPRWFSLTGLILGSMSPDFEYFMRLEPYRSIGHTTAGLFLQAIPLSILLALLFHLVVKKPLARHLPHWLAIDRRALSLITDWDIRSARMWIVFLYSVIIGFWLHIFVDEWTHIGGYYVTQLPYLATSVGGLPIFKWLQYGTSLLGLFIEGLLLVWLLSRAPLIDGYHTCSTKRKLIYWGIVIGTALLTTIVKLLSTSSTNVVGILVVSPISGGCLGIVAASVWDLLTGNNQKGVAHRDNR